MRIRKMQCEKNGKMVIIDGEYHEPEEYLGNEIIGKDERGYSIIAGREKLAEDLRKAVGATENTSLTWAYNPNTAGATSRLENAIETMDFLREHEEEFGKEGIDETLRYLSFAPIGREDCEYALAYHKKCGDPFSEVINKITGRVLIEGILSMGKDGAKYRHLALKQNKGESWDDLVNWLEKVKLKEEQEKIKEEQEKRIYEMTTKGKSILLEDLVVRQFGKVELSLSYKNPQEISDEDYKKIENHVKNVNWTSGSLKEKGINSDLKGEVYSKNDIYNYNWYGYNYFYQNDGVYQRVRNFLEGYCGSAPRRDCDSKTKDFCKSILNFKIINFGNKYLLTAKISTKSKTYEELGALDSFHFGRDWLLTNWDNYKSKLILRGMRDKDFISLF